MTAFQTQRYYRSFKCIPICYANALHNKLFHKHLNGVEL